MLDKGAILAGYRIDGLLGQGGMGVVYEATQLSLNRTVALKVLAQAASEDSSFRERFRREGRLQAAIDHPHIVSVYEAGESEDGLFLAMRLIRGPSLGDLILARELDADLTLKLLSQVADALDAAHEAGLVHRDIKPQNILLSGPGRDFAYLTDFGVTKASGAAKLTKAGQLVGTLDYVSPEQIRGQTVTNRCDVYAIGCVLYECLTGAVPFPQESEAAVLHAHLTEPPPRVSEHRPELPYALDAVLARAMSKDPAERHSSAGELMSEVANTFTDRLRSTLPAPPPSEWPEQAGTAPTEELVSTAAVEDAMEAPVSVVQRVRDAAVALGAVAVVAGLCVAGFFASHALSGSNRGPPKVATVRHSGITLRVSEPWRLQHVKQPLPGLASSVTLAPGVEGAAGLVAGRFAAVHAPTFLPPALRSQLSRRELVRLGPLQALRYRARTLRGFGGFLTLYVLPQPRRVWAIACFADRSVMLAECDGIASTARIAGAKPYPLLPNGSYTSALNGMLAKLNGARAGAGTTLAAATTPSGEAGALQTVATAYAVAAGTVRAVRTIPLLAGSANTALAQALARTGRKYRRLALAATAGSPARYHAARSAAITADQRVRTRLDHLAVLGSRG